jgi:hypothetical protein
VEDGFWCEFPAAYVLGPGGEDGGYVGPALNERMYRAVADEDRWHHHESMCWVGYEERKSGKMDRQLQAEKSQHDWSHVDEQK